LSKTVHIICLDAPSPPDYGGVFDLYYKIPALHKLGIKIILHYFDYKEGRSASGLEKFCEAIYSYKRSSFTGSLLSNQPFIVHSRINDALIKRLQEDNHPVIIEGIHCSGVIQHLEKNRKVILRLHNDEAAYYQHLAKWEPNVLRRLYLQREAKLLEQYQKQLPTHITVACVSNLDQQNFSRRYGFSNIHFIPCFIPWQEIRSEEGKGDYCLYHGNLEVSENIEAAKWLIENIFKDLTIPLIIAGKGAAAMVMQYEGPNVRFVDSPDDATLKELIANAHVHVLPSFNMTGVKLKLLHALFEGRFCFTNNAGVLGSGLNNYVRSLDADATWVTAIDGAMNTPYSEELKKERQQIRSVYNNEVNAQKLSELL
jgi:glycosyltransferase involved in cell wall biosynthesis